MCSKFQIEESVAGSLAGYYVKFMEEKLERPVSPFVRGELIKAFMGVLKPIEIEGIYLTHSGLAKHKQAKIDHYEKPQVKKRIYRRKRFAYTSSTDN